MALDLLDTPVRLTWDLHGPGPVQNLAGMAVVADRIAEAGVFFVTLEERPLAHPAIGTILATLAAGGCQVQSVCCGSEEELATLARLPEPLPAVLLDVAAFLEVGAFARERLQRTVAALRSLNVEPALQLIPTKSNISFISMIYDICREVGAGRIKLPNARIGDTFRSIPPADLPRWQDLETFGATWRLHVPQHPADLQVEIHDRFLWEIMTPDCEQSRSEYGGCQAANSLGHVDAAGTVYACAAWPQALGSLVGESLDAVWQAPLRYALRERIARTPAGCLGCRDYSVCFGGCRGLGEILGQDGGGRDLMCRGPR